MIWYYRTAVRVRTEAFVLDSPTSENNIKSSPGNAFGKNGIQGIYVVKGFAKLL